jgi:hypothetical protein
MVLSVCFGGAAEILRLVKDREFPVISRKSLN